MKQTEFKRLVKECIGDVLKESYPLSWDAWQRKKYGEEGKDWIAEPDPVNPSLLAMKKIKRPDEPLKTQSSTTGFGGYPNKAHGRQSEPQKYRFSEENEEIESKPEVDKAKMKMLNDILVTCGNMQKRVHSLTDTTIINGIRDIQDTTIKLMRSLGAK